MVSLRNAFMAIGAVVAVIGLLGIFGVDLGSTEPVWRSWVRVVVGTLAIYAGYVDKK